jgi:hypothetical protein
MNDLQQKLAIALAESYQRGWEDRHGLSETMLQDWVGHNWKKYVEDAKNILSKNKVKILASEENLNKTLNELRDIKLQFNDIDCI